MRLSVVQDAELRDCVVFSVVKFPVNLCEIICLMCVPGFIKLCSSANLTITTCKENTLKG